MLVGFAMAVAPIAIVSIVRLIVFGSAAPLSVAAKPSDLSHGLTYAGAACIVMLLPIVAPMRRVETIAFAVHVLAVLLAGGDWMPYARLVVPVTPSLVLALVRVPVPALFAVRVLSAVRWTLAYALGAYLLVQASPAGRHVAADRAALVAVARPLLASSHCVAALDIGWTSAAYDGPVLDLAGLTDPSIAVLPGGHTSKHVDVSMLLDRKVDTVVIYAGAPRAVELRLLRTPLFHERFAPSADEPDLPLGYRLYRRIRHIGVNASKAEPSDPSP